MEKTPNLHLPTWAETDLIQMRDFNDMTAKLDAAMKAETTARAAGDLYVRLADQTLSSAKKQMDIPLSGLGQYHQLDVRITPVTGSGCPDMLYLTVNGLTTGYRESGDGGDMDALAAFEVGTLAGNCCLSLVRIYLTGGLVAMSDSGYRYEAGNKGIFSASIHKRVRHLPLSPDSVYALNLKGWNKGWINLPAGTRVQVYGYRK